MGEALLRCRALDGAGLAWVEEPLRYDDLAGHARLARDIATPIMLGENFYGPRAMLAAIQAQACDLVMPDLMRIGGVTGWLQAAAIADASGLPMSSHLYPEVSGHLLGVTPTRHWLEWQDWANPVLARPFQVTDGLLHLPDVPGNGLALGRGRRNALPGHPLSRYIRVMPSLRRAASRPGGARRGRTPGTHAGDARRGRAPGTRAGDARRGRTPGTRAGDARRGRWDACWGRAPGRAPGTRAGDARRGRAPGARQPAAGGAQETQRPRAVSTDPRPAQCRR